MSKPETFIARWSRLKHESGAVLPEETVEGAIANGEAAPPAFDLASLPPIEAILAGGDIKPFLQSGVPTDLTRAALRSAWAADPVIRDFIGTAENQWDFNDPAGIPGFGPLGAQDVARGFVGRNLAGLGAASAVIAGAAGLTAPSVGATPDPHRDDHVDKVWLGSARPAPHRPDASPATQATSQTDGDRGQGSRRSHGSALPK
jgi:hypothetical protein